MLRILLIVCLLSSVASAQRVMTMTSHGKLVEAVVFGERVPALAEVQLRVTDRDAVRARSVDADHDAAALEIVVSEQTADKDLMRPIETAFDELAIAQRFPRGTMAGVVTFAKDAHVRAPLAPIEQLRGKSLVWSSDPALPRDLVVGVVTAANELEHAAAARKVMIIISDGGSEPAPALDALAQRLKSAGIETFGINYRSDATMAVWKIAPDTRIVNSPEGIIAELRGILDRAQRFKATFDVSSLPVWTGRESTFALLVGDRPVGVGSLRLPAAPRPWWRPVWVQLAAGVVIVGLLALLLKLRAQRLP